MGHQVVEGGLPLTIFEHHVLNRWLRDLPEFARPQPALVHPENVVKAQDVDLRVQE